MTTENNSMSDDIQDIVKLSHEIKMQWILFYVTIAIFILGTGLFFFMAFTKYDWQSIAAVGGVDTGYIFILLRITKSLFKSDN
ncbi:hypothetical protein [Psychroserpens luteus]|uniref:Uncharacterized protein n=1 Tax=Psychroserpens luteus TaxID=1434066 RepID=A0ABW5ZQ15_9FLAO|nr:hypothetical protein [Psychroserpens luteus]